MLGVLADVRRGQRKTGNDGNAQGSVTFVLKACWPFEKMAEESNTQIRASGLRSTSHQLLKEALGAGIAKCIPQKPKI